MGGGIACMSALAGHETVIVDIREDLAANGVNKAIEYANLLAEKGLADVEVAANVDKLLSGTTDRRSACENCGLVIEAIIEKVELKQQLFCELEELVPDNIPILSNTSGLRITEISKYMKHPERALTAHFWFPAYLVPLVEIVMHERSEESYAIYVRDLLKKWNKAPVIVRRDLPGQLANRVLQAMIRETVSIVESGLATAEDVDTAIKMGPGIRLPVWGILEHADAVGVNLVHAVQNTTLPDLAKNTEASPLLQEMLDKNQLGVKAGEGFYDWNKRSFADLEALRNDMIVAAVKLIREHEKA